VIQPGYECTNVLSPNLLIYRSAPRCIIQLPVDGRHLLYPAVALEVIQFEQIIRRPVKVIRQIGYLFVELL
jgi:hypothetical protein